MQDKSRFLIKSSRRWGIIPSTSYLIETAFFLKVQFVLLDLCNLVFGIWFLEFGFWNLGFGIWVLEFGFWNLGFGFWNLEFGIWNLEFGVLEFGLLDFVILIPFILTKITAAEDS